jgi:tetratricopeptide (TPR) repeat protein
MWQFRRWNTLDLDRAARFRTTQPGSGSTSAGSILTRKEDTGMIGRGVRFGVAVALATLGHLGRYPESLQAYGEALRLRPDFPEALEYLGEVYAGLGRLDDARRVLERLRPLDARRAGELAEAIGRASATPR